MKLESFKKATPKKTLISIIAFAILTLILVSSAIKKRPPSPTHSVQVRTNSQQTPKNIPYFSRQALTKKLSEKSKIKSNKLVYDLTKISRDENAIFLYGGLGEKGNPGGKHFFVKITKDPEEIKVIYIGEQPPKCSLLDSQGFPGSWHNLCRKDE